MNAVLNERTDEQTNERINNNNDTTTITMTTTTTITTTTTTTTNQNNQNKYMNEQASAEVYKQSIFCNMHNGFTICNSHIKLRMTA